MRQDPPGRPLATDVLAGYPVGVVFADLTPVSDGNGVRGALAHALGLRDESADALVDSLVDHFAAGAALVVLDNCEHLVDACATLAEVLLRGAPGLRVLATSRAPLDVEGETAWRVPSLSLPRATSPSGLDLDGSEAVALFVDRARRMRSDFTLDETNAPAVAEICCRLEGIPLAIELAAARARVLGPQRIAAGLDDQFRLLTGGTRSAVARHRTLRASVDWSHDLLTEPERTLFRRLAPFAGTFDLTAAEAVGAGGDLAARQVLDELTQLVDKSLVDVVDVGPGTRGRNDRFRLLETIRQYACERLETSGEDEASAGGIATTTSRQLTNRHAARSSARTRSRPWTRWPPTWTTSGAPSPGAGELTIPTGRYGSPRSCTRSGG